VTIVSTELLVSCLLTRSWSSDSGLVGRTAVSLNC